VILQHRISWTVARLQQRIFSRGEPYGDASRTKIAGILRTKYPLRGQPGMASSDSKYFLQNVSVRALRTASKRGLSQRHLLWHSPG
jgi:hypothetical protein